MGRAMRVVGAGRVRLVVGLWLVAAVLVLPGIGTGAARAAEGDLTYDSCIGQVSGCIFVANNLLNDVDSLAVSPNGGSVYAASHPDFNPGVPAPALDGVLVHLVADAGGRLSYQGCLSDSGTSGNCTALNGADSLLSLEDVAVSPSGASVYTGAPGHGDYGGISHFFADPVTGDLSYDGCVSDNGTGGLCLDAPGTGTLPGVDGVAVSPNGGSVYAAVQIPDSGGGSGGIAHLFAAPGQGQLSWDGCISNDGDGGNCVDVPGTGTPINGGIGVAVSPNGASVYMTGVDGISHFTANPDQGQLTWEGCVSNDGSGGACADIPGTGAPMSYTFRAVVSPDGSSVYTAGYGAVSQFSADASGRLTFADCASSDGSSGTCTTIPPRYGSLLYPVDLAISPDGHTLYVASSGADAVSWFSLGAQGTLTFAGCLSDLPVSGCVDPPGDSLVGADAVAVSPDGKSVYVGTSSGAIVRLSREPAAGSGGSSGGSGGSGGTGGTGATGASSFTRTVTFDRRRVTLTGTWPARCVASSASLGVGLAAVALGGRAKFAGAGFYLDRGVRTVHRRIVKRNGHRRVVRTIVYRPQLTVHRLPAGTTLPLTGLVGGSHRLRAVVSYRLAKRRHGRLVHAVSSRTLTLPFSVC